MEPVTASTSSSPQLLGILNTPPKLHRPSPYVRQNSNSMVQSSTANQTLTPGAKVVQISSHTPVKQNAVFPSVSMSPMVPAPSDQRPIPILQNVVGTANLSCQLDLLAITSRTRNTEYNPSRFSGIVMRLREPRTTALVFQSGKMVVTGARSEADCNLASRKIARIMQKLGYNIAFTGFRVTNVVATCDLKFPIRVESLNMMHGQFSSYEPELFPGLIYRMINPRVVILVFVNGKLCFTGAKNQEELNLAMDNIYPILKSFKKQ